LAPRRRCKSSQHQNAFIRFAPCHDTGCIDFILCRYLQGGIAARQRVPSPRCHRSSQPRTPKTGHLAHRTRRIAGPFRCPRRARRSRFPNQGTRHDRLCQAEGIRGGAGASKFVYIQRLTISSCKRFRNRVYWLATPGLKEHWKKITSAACIDSTCVIGTKTETDRHHVISSLPADSERVCAGVRATGGWRCPEQFGDSVAKSARFGF